MELQVQANGPTWVTLRLMDGPDEVGAVQVRIERKSKGVRSLAIEVYRIDESRTGAVEVSVI